MLWLGDQMVRKFLALCLLVFGLSGPALAQSGYALIIANEAYSTKVGPLNNPYNDAKLMDTALKKLGYETTIIRDASRGDILKAVDEHARKLKAAPEGTVSFIYYSGHGASKPNTDQNYIIPVTVTDASSPSMWFDAVSLDSVRNLLSEHAPASPHIVVFDACRNELQMPVRGAKGFAVVQNWGGMLIAYSTSPNMTASDGVTGDKAGPYVLTLATELENAKGVSAAALFGRVRAKVRDRTNGQSPWFLYGLDREVIFGEKSDTDTKDEFIEIDPVPDEDKVPFSKLPPVINFLNYEDKLVEKLFISDRSFTVARAYNIGSGSYYRYKNSTDGFKTPDLPVILDYTFDIQSFNLENEKWNSEICVELTHPETNQRQQMCIATNKPNTPFVLQAFGNGYKDQRHKSRLNETYRPGTDTHLNLSLWLNSETPGMVSFYANGKFIVDMNVADVDLNFTSVRVVGNTGKVTQNIYLPGSGGYKLLSSKFKQSKANR